MLKKISFDEFLVNVSLLPRVHTGFVYNYNDAVKDEYQDRIAGATVVTTIRTHWADTREEAEEELMQKCIALMDSKKFAFVREMPNVEYHDAYADMPAGWYGRARIGVSND